MPRTTDRTSLALLGSLSCAALLISGCIGSTDAGQESAADVAALRSDLGAAEHGALTWSSHCTQACTAFEFEVVSVPDGASLEASVTWNYRDDDLPMSSYHATLHRANGEIVSEPHDFYFTSMTYVDDPEVGAYELRVEGNPDAATLPPFQVVVQFELPPTADINGDFLPNLGALTPSQLRIPDEGAGQNFPGTGCQLAEMVEQQSTRCLRFSSGFKNTGAGDLFAFLSDPTSPAPRWTQVIETIDGKREHSANEARYHALHGHFHYEAALEATVYQFELTGLIRGEAVNAGSKTGFCFEDWGIVEGAMNGTAPGGYACYEQEAPTPIDVALANLDPTMGVSAGWYDLYTFHLPDQYVDMQGVPDGVYELVNVADPDGTLIEERTDDNEASMVFRLTGNDVEILGTPAELRVT